MFCIKNQKEQVASIRFTYLTKDNEQKCSGSSKWLSLGLGAVDEPLASFMVVDI